MACCVDLEIGGARNLSRRIVAPVASMAEATRRITSGDLSTGVEVGKENLGKVTDLAEDFNAISAQLQTLDREAAFWNPAIAHELPPPPLTVLHRHLQGVQDGVFKMAERLVEDLGIVSLAETGYLILTRQSVALHDLVAQHETTIGPQLRQAGFDVTCRPGKAFAEVDASRIGQALLALLDNARQHATPGPLTCESLVEDGQAVLRVVDSGPGVAPDERGQIFERFRRVSDANPGSGLGLAVFRAIAEAHGGQALRLPPERRISLRDAAVGGLRSPWIPAIGRTCDA